MNIKYCTKCEKEIANTSNYCPECGTLLIEKKPQKDSDEDQNLRICTKCGHLNKSESKFCMKCGTSLTAKVCPACGFANNTESNFCKKCGFRLSYVQEGTKPGVIYDVYGIGGRHMEVYEDRLVISTNLSFESFLFGNATTGEKTIYYVDCNGIQIKKSGIAYGYLQLETASSMMSHVSSNFFNENSFAYDLNTIPQKKIEEVVKYIKNQIHNIKTNKVSGSEKTSPADEIKKYKELLDLGAITEEEYNKKKKELLK